jgi:hypothetical protein
LVADELPNSLSVRASAVNYRDATRLEILAPGGYSYDDGVTDGAEDLVRNVHKKLAACSGNEPKVVVIGYSQGAHAAKESLGMFDADDRKHIAAVVLLADPTHDPNDKVVHFPLDGAKYTPAHGRGIARNLSMTVLVPRWARARTATVCWGFPRKADPVCNVSAFSDGYGWADVLEGDWAAHKKPYTNTAKMTEIAQWVVQRITSGPVPTCYGRPATHIGTNGNDTIVGSAHADVIVGRGGNDNINGKGGNDRICGQGGNDTIKGGAGADRINGGGGNDTINGGPGNDILNGGKGTDTCKNGESYRSCEYPSPYLGFNGRPPAKYPATMSAVGPLTLGIPKTDLKKLLGPWDDTGSNPNYEMGGYDHWVRWDFPGPAWLKATWNEAEGLPDTDVHMLHASCDPSGGTTVGLYGGLSLCGSTLQELIDTWGPPDSTSAGSYTVQYGTWGTDIIKVGVGEAQYSGAILGELITSIFIFRL